MATKVIMPALGMAQETGKLISWLKKDGDTVTKGEPIMEIETDKAVVEYDAAASGVLGGIRVAAGDEVPVGEVVAWILDPGEAVPEQPETGPAAVPAAEKHAPPPQNPVMDVSPVARNIAREHNVDLKQLKTNGSRIRKANRGLPFCSTNTGVGSPRTSATLGFNP